MRCWGMAGGGLHTTRPSSQSDPQWICNVIVIRIFSFLSMEVVRKKPTLLLVAEMQPILAWRMTQFQRYCDTRKYVLNVETCELFNFNYILFVKTNLSLMILIWGVHLKMGLITRVLRTSLAEAPAAWSLTILVTRFV